MKAEETIAFTHLVGDAHADNSDTKSLDTPDFIV